MRTQWDNGIYTIQVVKHGWAAGKLTELSMVDFSALRRCLMTQMRVSDTNGGYIYIIIIIIIISIIINHINIYIYM